MTKPVRNGNPLLPYTEKQLPSGFTLIHKEVRSAPIVTLDFWIHTGAIHDPEPHFGLSHFYEHMFFKGTEKHGVGVMDRIITSLGGYNNAATSLDYTHYYVVLPSAGWRAALEVMADSLLHPLFDPEEIERERAVIVEEIKRHEDNPWAKIYDEFIEAAFANNRYQRKVLGTVDSLQTIDQGVFQDYQRKRYHPRNTTLSLAGDFSLAEVEDALGEIMGGETSEPFEDETAEWPLIEAPVNVELRRDVNQAYLLIGYPAPRTLGTPDEYSLDLLSTLLGEGRSSRLHRRLIDELGIASSVSCSAWGLKNATLFIMEAATDADKIDRVEQVMQEELDRVRDGITLDELEKVKSMERADFSFSNEKISSMAHTYGYSRVAADIEHAIHYLERLDEVDIESIQRAYDAHLTPSRRCRGALLPKRG
ncbi:MAG: hypothetical protein GC154_06160 [bacterium]|nr:hypothetical protein [bacterium]